MLQEDVAEMRALQQLRLDELHRRLWGLSEDEDSKTAIQTALACLRIYERQAKLFGLDQPTELKHSGSIAMDQKVEVLAIIDELLPADVTQPDPS